MPESTKLCTRCRVAPREGNLTYCPPCKRVLNQEARTRRNQREAERTPKIDTDVPDPDGRLCARCKEAVRLSHMSYCRLCHRELARESRVRTGGKKPQTNCSRCGKIRTGRHQSYCIECNKEYKMERATGPCIRCGKPRPEGDNSHSSYCYHCWRSWWLMRKYGITADEYDEMLAAQDNRCALCRCEHNGRMWHIDHCHVTKRNRKILCDNCNRGLGHFKDDPVVLRRAADYVEEFSLAG